MTEKNNSDGREHNSAQPLGERRGQISHEGTIRGGERSRRRAGPDGPDAADIGDTFKQQP